MIQARLVKVNEINWHWLNRPKMRIPEIINDSGPFSQSKWNKLTMTEQAQNENPEIINDSGPFSQ